MPVPPDPSPELQQYARPEVLVTTGWLAEHLDDPDVVIVESDEDVLLYDTGHIPGAVKVDWHLDLNDPVTRDYVDGEKFAALMSRHGISRDSTVVFYGDNFNWWAAYALWVFTLFEHPDVRLLNGGRMKWTEEGRPMTTDVPSRPPADYPVVERKDPAIRAFRDDVMDHVDAKGRLVDVRSPGEYSGELLHMADYPQEGALRGGHIPGASSVPWKRAARRAAGHLRRRAGDLPR
jgi:thiosulfate/3-mercaptopyruvate sulfurtransferase